MWLKASVISVGEQSLVRKLNAMLVGMVISNLIERVFPGLA